MITGIKPVPTYHYMEMIVFGSDVKTVSLVNPKTGRSTLRTLNAREFKEQHLATNPKASNRDVKKAYAEYCNTAYRANTEGFAAEMSKGNIGIKGIVMSKDGVNFDVKCVRMDKLAGAKLTDLEAQIRNLSAEDLAKLMEVASKLTAVDAGK